MNRVKITLSYDGTLFHGWQIQPNDRTVQGEVQKALSQLFGTEMHVFGCSRTDAGVHAKKFVCHTDLPKPFPLDKLPFALNAMLPYDVSIKKAESVSDDFHARFSCTGKTYSYYLHNARIRDPFQKHRAGFWPTPLNAERMDAFAKQFIGRHDFASFMATGSVIEDTVREIVSFDVKREGDMIVFTVCGNGFLYNMVRIMVGTLIYADVGRLDRSISDIITAKDRTLAGITVSPQGLYLEEPCFEPIV